MSNVNRIKKILRDRHGKRVNIGSRVKFNAKACSGYGEIGTVVEFEQPMRFNNDPIPDPTSKVVSVLWDCHGGEVGEVMEADDFVLKEWDVVMKKPNPSGLKTLLKKRRKKRK